MRLQDVYETPERIFMVQELCTGRTLLDVIRAQAPMKEERAATLFRGIIKSVLHCHQVRPGTACAALAVAARSSISKS